MEFDIQRVADNLRAERARRRMTAEQAAAVSGVNVESLRGYEAGRTMMKIEAAWRLADFYEMSIDELLGHERKEAR